MPGVASSNVHDELFVYAARLYPQPLKMQPAYCQAGRGLRSRQEAAKATAKLDGALATASQPPGGQLSVAHEQGRSLAQLHRLLLLEESAMEADICRSGTDL